MNIQTSASVKKEARQPAPLQSSYSMPLKDFHPGAPQLFRDDTLWPYFERLRKEEPVHYCTNAPIDPYWSVVKYDDIMHVDTNHGIFSSDAALGGINMRDAAPGYDQPSFISMDQPRHADQRKTVSPTLTPAHPPGLCPPQLHFDGSPAPRRSPQDRLADVHADTPGRARHPDPAALGES